MQRAHQDRGAPLSTVPPDARLSRRAMLGALGSAVIAATAGVARRNGAPAAFAQGTPEVAAPPPPTRPPGGPDLGQLLLDLNYDADAIFRFVADDIAYESYAGALRGAKGTHWSLAGNSVDKAILLADLLTQAQVTVRFAAGPLNDGVANQLLASMQIDAAAARDRLNKVAAGGTVALDQHPGLSPEQLAILQSPGTLRKTLLDHAAASLTAGVDAIESALAGAKIALPASTLVIPDSEREQHVWVQYADGPRWVDLDPSFARGEAGRAYATQAETWDVIPDALYHRVRFRCIVESNRAGVATQEDSFVHEARAADLVGVPVVFAHVDPNAIAKLGVSIGGILQGTTQYVPTLLAGPGGEVGTPITLGGSGGALDVLGSAGSDVSPLAEWLEITVSAPDGSMQQATREVFDRIGVARRGGGIAGASTPVDVDLATLPPIELVDVPQLGKVFFPLEVTWLLGVVGGRIPGTYFDQDYAIADVQADMAVIANGSFAARDVLQAEIAASYGYRWYHNQPNITAAILAPDTSDPTAVRLGASLDLIAQGYAVVPLAGTTASAHPLVLAGVLAHVAERFGADAAAMLSPDAPVPVGSVAQVFAEAATAGVAIRTVQPGSPDLSALAISDVAKARIGEALAAGYVVIVPERAVQQGDAQEVGWWQVDPKTGRTFDLMENGRGGSPMGEDTVIIVGGPAWRAATAWKILSFTFGFIIAFSVAMAIFMYPN